MASAITSGWPDAWNSAWGFASMASRRLALMIVWILLPPCALRGVPGSAWLRCRAGDGLLCLGLGEDHLLG